MIIRAITGRRYNVPGGELVCIFWSIVDIQPANSRFELPMWFPSTSPNTSLHARGSLISYGMLSVHSTETTLTSMRVDFAQRLVR